MKKSPILIATAALALAVFGLAACGGSNQQAASGGNQGSSEATAPAAAQTSAAVEATSAEVQNPASIESNTMGGDVAVYDYDGKGIIFFDYPTGAFKEDPSAILGTLEALDGSVTIKFNADYTYETDGKQKRLDYMDGYSSYEGYAADDLTIAGLPAHRIYYVDPDWGDSMMEIMIDLEGTAQDKYSDICAIVSSKDSERVRSDDIMEILNSLHIG